MDVTIIPNLTDNYAYLISNPETKEAAIIDPGEAEPTLRALDAQKLRLTAILNTHHHFDHVGGNEALLARFPELRVFGSAKEADRIPGITDRLEPGQRFEVIGARGEVLFVPCHTRGHVAFRFGDRLFSGDTLFAAGCGRFFEGTAADMFHALYEIIGKLEDEVSLYPGHEYTAKNLEFALSLEPGNESAQRKLTEVRALREKNEPSIPTRLSEERSYNPFLRADVESLGAAAQAFDASVDPKDPIQVLGALRAMKDNF